MFDTPLEPWRHWQPRGQVRRHGADPLRRPAGSADSELLALLCPDWGNATVVLDVASHEVAYANLRALDLFKRRYPLLVVGGTLQFAAVEDSRRFRSALQRAVGSDSDSGTVVIDDPVHDTTYSLRIRLPHGFMREILERNVDNAASLAVLDIVSGVAMVSRTDLRALGVAFGLTLAETTILDLIAQGHALGDIARLRGVAMETVRHQCKRLLSKTRSRRQSDLVKLVVALCAQEGAGAASGAYHDA